MSTTVATDPIQLVKLAVACYVLGDTEGMQAILAPDGECHIPGDPAVVPWAGTHHGREGLGVFHQRAKELLDILVFDVKGYHLHGDTVHYFAFERARYKPTGKVYEQELVGFMTVRDGHVTRYLEYGDTAAVEAAVRG